MTTESPPAKRQRQDESLHQKQDPDALHILSTHVRSSADKLRTSFRSAQPFPHGRINDMFREDFLLQVLEEVKHNSKVKFKESDLFRVYQSIDFGNVTEGSDLAKQLPSLVQLKRTLYSLEYRSFVEQINDLPPGTLTEEVDCAANCHAPGCHLLCHDDVIGTRKVSFIIYLTEKGWSSEEGGALELYGSTVVGGDGDSNRRVPEAIPSKTILPTFNSMAYFVVAPGVSFHAVQEVYGERPRLSIQGWYHCKSNPERIEEATLCRLKSGDREEDTEGQFQPFKSNGSTSTTFSESDRKYLSSYINATYLKDQSMNDIRQRFEEDSSVQLRHFLREELASVFEKADKKLGNGAPSLDYSIASDEKCWKVVGPAHKQRFLELVRTDTAASDNPSSSAGRLMNLKQKVFESDEFRRFLQAITSLGMPTAYRGRIRRFRPGLDYTVAHYGMLTKESVLDATMCFAAGKGEQCVVDEETGEVQGSESDALWESGDCGGFECYIAADEEEEMQVAAEYNEEDDTELLSVAASNNTLSLVFRDPGTMRFVKYVGCRAPSSRWDVSMEYQVPEDD